MQESTPRTHKLTTNQKLRGNVVVGNHAVVGHATEVKNSVFLSHAKAGHFAYVGDSVLGHNVNLGAGTKLANLKIIPSNIVLRCDGEKIVTKYRKMGAILGDIQITLLINI